jgi:hypothetical protein
MTRKEGLRAYKKKIAFRREAKLCKKRHFPGWQELGFFLEKWEGGFLMRSVAAHSSGPLYTYQRPTYSSMAR